MISSYKEGGWRGVQRQWALLCVLTTLLFMGGCETARGMKKDFSNTWSNAQTWDEWVKENLW